MRLFFYSSPYKYYADNLIPIAEYAKDSGHTVYGSYCLNKANNISSVIETPIISKPISNNPLKMFLSGRLPVDAVILTQPWWYMERNIVRFCNRMGIPFYIVDHAPIMTEYEERGGRESHMYRSSLFGARMFFSYGQRTIDIMKKKGCRENMISIGSPRLEDMLGSIEQSRLSYKKKKKIAVLYDTSDKMEDKVAVKNMMLLKKDLDKRGEWEFLLREHPRSPGLFRQLCDKFENFNLSKKRSESELCAISALSIFSFPSSSMIINAMAKNNIVSIYGNHFSYHARKYSKKYDDVIFNYVYGSFNYDAIMRQKKYKKFLKENIKLLSVPSKIRILRYIEEDLK